MNGAILNQSVKGSASNISASYPVASGNTVSAGDVVDVVNGEVKGFAGKPLSSFAEKSIITLIEGGKPVEFYVVKHNYESSLNGAGRTLILRKDPYKQMEYNKNVMVNTYNNSTLDRWFNLEYLNLFSEKIKTAIGTTTIKWSASTTAVSNLTKSVFALSVTEYNAHSDYEDYSQLEGTAVPNAEFYRKNPGDKYSWTRTKNPDYDNKAFEVLPSYISCDSKQVDDTTVWARPAFTLPNTFLVQIDVPSCSQAIALYNANAGQIVEVAYSGTFESPWAKQGTQITSDGVNGFVPLDGVLSVTPYWDKGTKMAYGSYVGDDKTERTLDLGFRPKMIIISCLYEQGGGSYMMGGVPWVSPVPSAQTQRGGNGSWVKIKWSDMGLSWKGDSGSNASDCLNDSRWTYQYIAFY